MSGTPLLSLLASGFVLGWSVAWPPGPINAEIARRCLAGGFWSGFGLLAGACAGDAAWALLVLLGVGVAFTGPRMQLALGVLSITLLLGLAAVFLRGAWRAARGTARPAAARFDGRRASFLLGMTLALTSPWNAAFWLAAIGRPELTQHGAGALLAMVAAIIAGALTWGLVWSGAVVGLRRHAGGAGARWWDVLVRTATAALMLYFAQASARALLGG
ncbi:MAG: LysE family transporter [Acetobacteraceae bacterium]|nr:LysE family transporter [Acetobacteraceae bacterium]